jgi:predicted alpha/beta hydrolase
LSEARTIHTDDGWVLAAEFLPATSSAWGVAVCGHAMMCNRRTLDRPAGGGLGSTLAAAGLNTFLVDLRGHGESVLPDPSAQYTYDDVVLRDIPSIVRTVHQWYPDLPLVWLGHSLAGHGAMAALGVHPDLPIAALVNLAGNVWLDALEPSRPMRWIKRAIAECWMGVSRIRGRFPARFLRVGTEDEALPYVAQLVGFSRQGRWGSLDGRHDYLALLERVGTPVFSVVGKADTWMCRPESARLWLEHATASHVTHRVVGDVEGDPVGIDHMGLVTNPAMKPVWNEMVDWIRRTVSEEENRPNA